jgi:hypothetical protein
LGKQFLYSFFKVCASLKRQTFTTMMNRTVYVTALLLMVSVSFVNAQPAFEQRSLEEALNPDGTLKRGAQGSFKVEGYTMRTGKNGEPIFEPQTQHTASGTWSSLGNGVSGGSGFPDVRALAVVGNEVVVGGNFTSADGVSANRVARFNTLTNTWSRLGTGSSNGVSGGFYPYVYALAVVGNEVVVGGFFSSAGGVSANNVARFNTLTNTWSRLGTGSSNGVSGGDVLALAVVGNEVYVGGSFTSAGGVSANRVARFNTATNTWSSLGTGSSNGVSGGNVYALAVVGNEVYVGGNFTSAGGVSANRVARFNTLTNTWSALGTGSSNGVFGNVGALAVVGNEVVVGGGFTSAGGVSANSVARFNTLTNTWSALGTGSSNGVSGPVFALAVVGNEVVVGGNFTSAGGVSANRVARFNTQTNTWSSLGTGSSNGVNDVVNALAVVGNEVYVGGWFTLAGGVFASRVARYNDPDNPLPVELVSFRGTATAQGVQLTWQTATELNNAGFEVRRKTAGEDFVTIASYRFDPSLRGKGTTSSTTTYSFVDATVEAGKTYTYRLRSVDYDGTIHDYAQTVSVEVREPVQARGYEYALEQNYPNPFNPTTTIRYSLKETGKVSVRVYDVMGREVKVLVDGVQGAGEYSVVMDAMGLSSGVYVYQLRAGGLLLTRKMVLAK